MPISVIRAVSALLGLLAPLAAAAPAQAAQEKQEIQISGNAGWTGRVARGDWTPVFLDIDNRGKDDREIILAVTWAAPGASQSEANPTLQSLGARFGPVHEFPLVVPGKSRKRFSVPLL